VVSPSAKRRAVKLVIEVGLGKTAQACRALGLARSSYYRNSTMSPESRRFQKQIVSLSQEHPRYGYRRVTALLRREGQEINPKRVQRVRRKEGLQVSRRQRKLRRLGGFDRPAATGPKSQSRLELGFCGGPDGERNALSGVDVD
jgi:putative transposase